MTADDFTREPTGLIAWPFVLIEGDSGAGKTAQALRLSASPRVGRTFAFGFGDAGTLDEYKRLGPYRIVKLTGLYTDFLHKLDRAIAERPFEGRPNVLVIDNGHLLWDSLKDWTTERAKHSAAGRRALAADPDAAITVASNYWNDANARWRAVMRRLLSYDGIVVMTAQGKYAARFVNGQIVEGQKEWVVEGPKTLVQDARVWVRLHREPRRAELVKVRSLHAGEGDGAPTPLDLGDVLTTPGILDALIFDRIGAGGTFAVATGVEATNGVLVPDAKTQVVEAIKVRLGVEVDEAVPLAAEAWTAAGLPIGRDDEVPLDTVDDVVTAAIANAARQHAERAAAGTPEPASAPAGGDELDPDELREQILAAATAEELRAVWERLAAAYPGAGTAGAAARAMVVGDEHAQPTSLHELFARAGQALKAGTRLRGPQTPEEPPDGPGAPGGGGSPVSDDVSPGDAPFEPDASPAGGGEEPAPPLADSPPGFDVEGWMRSVTSGLTDRDVTVVLAGVRRDLGPRAIDPSNPDDRAVIERHVAELRAAFGIPSTGGWGDPSVDPLDGPGLDDPEADANQAVALLTRQLGAAVIDDEKDPTDLGLSPPTPPTPPPRPVDHRVNRDGAAAARAELDRARRTREGQPVE